MDLRASEKLLGRALDLLDADDPRRPRVAVDLAEALTWRGRFAEADALLQEPTTLTGAPAYATLARCRWLFESSPPEGVKMIGRELPAVRDELVRTGDERGLARVELVQSAIHSWELQSESGFAAARRAAEHARRAGDRALLVRALGIQVSRAGQGPQPRAAVEELLDTIEQSDAGPATAAKVLFERSLLAQYDGRFDDARRTIQAACSVLLEAGEDVRAPGMGYRMAKLEMAAGHNAAAIRILQETRPELARLGLHDRRSTQTAYLADALYRAGHLDEAEHMARQAEAEGAPDDIINAIIIPAVRARIRADRGDTDSAIELAELAVEAAYRTDHPCEHGNAELTLAHVLATAGRGPEAVNAANRALARYELKGDHTSAAKARNLIVSVTNASPTESPRSRPE
jgi:tetratricopeptide (TPR) repeat protein